MATKEFHQNNIVDKISKICEETFDIESLQLGEGYYYDSLPLCVIDAVFSIGVRYKSTANVVKRYCDHFKLARINADKSATYDRHSISDLIYNINQMEIWKFTEDVFRNHQRTSTKNGILKTEAILLFAEALEADGIRTFFDIREKGLSVEAESRIKSIPGQHSGISLQYFYMLSGSDGFCKPDRHLIQFFSHCTGTQLSAQEVEELIAETVGHLRKRHNNITVRLLDSAIWAHMSAKKPLPSISGAKVYNKLVRDKIPQIIEQLYMLI